MGPQPQASARHAFGRRRGALLTRSLWPAYGLRFAGLIAAYYAAAHIGYAFQFSGPVASIVWLPVGVGIAGLYLFGPRLWPAVLVGDLLVNNYMTLPVGAAVGQTFGNVIEVVIAAMVLRRFAARQGLLSTTTGVAVMLAALMAGTLISATVGTLSLFAGNVVPAGSFGHVWRTWWLGDFSGAMVVVPLALVFAPAAPRFSLRGRLAEATLVLAALIVLSLIAVQGGPPLSYLAFPALIWAALRFGPAGAAVAFATSAAFTIWDTTHSLGPFALGSINHSLLDAQVYLAVAGLTALAVAALACEREQLAESVRASRSRIALAAHQERRRLERDLHDGAQGRLVALTVRLALAARRAHDDPDTAAASLESARAELEVAIDELRQLVHGMRPATLHELGLAAAVEAAAGRSVIPVDVTGLPRVRFDEPAEVAAYYLILETLTNAQRHSGASAVRVHGSLSQRTLLLEIEDDGRGGAVERDGGGLQGLRDRVEATGGKLMVTSRPGEGTRVMAQIPVTIVADGIRSGADPTRA
jgi:signal transduction histidine kinase